MLEGGPGDLGDSGPVHLPVPFCLSLCVCISIWQCEGWLQRRSCRLFYGTWSQTHAFSLRQIAGGSDCDLAPCLVLVNQSCLTLSDPMTRSPPGPDHEILQASYGSHSLLQDLFQPRDWSSGQFGAYESRNCPARHLDTDMSRD